jgi:serine/threonine protein kinase
LDKLLTCNPRDRITATDALEHDYFWTDPLPADPKTLVTSMSVYSVVLTELYFHLLLAYRLMKLHMSSISVVVGTDLQMGNTDLNKLSHTLVGHLLLGKLFTMVLHVVKCIHHIHSHHHMLTHITDQSLHMHIRLMDCHTLQVPHLFAKGKDLEIDPVIFRLDLQGLLEEVAGNIIVISEEAYVVGAGASNMAVVVAAAAGSITDNIYFFDGSSRKFWLESF